MPLEGFGTHDSVNRMSGSVHSPLRTQSLNSRSGRSQSSDGRSLAAVSRSVTAYSRLPGIDLNTWHGNLTTGLANAGVGSWGYRFYALTLPNICGISVPRLRGLIVVRSHEHYIAPNSLRYGAVHTGADIRRSANRRPCSRRLDVVPELSRDFS